MIAKNDHLTGVVRLTHSAEDVGDMTDVTTVEIYRRVKGEEDRVLIATVLTLNVNELNFEVVDYTAASKTTYEYIAQPFSDAMPGTAVIVEVYSDFDGVFIGDDHSRYIAVFDPKCTYQQNYNMNFVQPFYSRFPHAIQNGDANYATGTASGTFNALDEACQIKLTYAPLAKEVIAFLTNGNPKILKSYDGNVWCVQPNNAVARDGEQRMDIVAINFSWTEVMDVPDDCGLVMYL